MAESLHARAVGIAGLAGPFVAAWLALHLAALGLLALVWGLVVAAKVILGWLAHSLVFLILLVSGALLVLWLWKAAQPRRLPRPA
ncbi:MAG TPA: hypothetical protein VFS01_05430 [Rhizomicrobium sp.]|jgi:Flp pilus assembly protein TadB|nr:hypothetical protein [Rhizomicrobium sp.]